MEEREERQRQPWRNCRSVTSEDDACICGASFAHLVPEGHTFQTAATTAYNKLSKDDPLRAHYEAIWPELVASQKAAAAPPVGPKAVEAAARRLDKFQRKVRAAGKAVECAKQHLADSERKLDEATEQVIAAEEEFDTLKAQVNRPDPEPAGTATADNPVLAALLEQCEKEPDDFHKWAEPEKEVWRAAKAKGEAMANKVREQEAETAKHLQYMAEETAKHQEQLRQIEQARLKRQPEAAADQAERSKGSPEKRPCPSPAPQRESAGKSAGAGAAASARPAGTAEATATSEAAKPDTGAGSKDEQRRARADAHTEQARDKAAQAKRAE
ncbi:unnamed protein product, partial [Prorocentrum cordatum]